MFSVFLSVLQSVEQLPAATQAAAYRHSTSEQPGGALPFAELFNPREIQVSTCTQRRATADVAVLQIQ